MHADDVLSLGLGVTPPWKLVGQRLDTDKRPNELHIEVAADCGARFAAFKAFLEQHGGKPGRIVEADTRGARAGGIPRGSGGSLRIMTVQRRQRRWFPG